jgi:nucleotide-binding universal stress UspA family protein
MFKSILIPVDGSPCSEKAVTEGTRLAKTLRAKVVLLHVMEKPDALYGGSDPVAFHDALYVELRKRANLVLERYRKLVGQSGVSVRTLLFEENYPVNAILQQHTNHDLIVMGTHGRKGAKRWFVGSVAEAVLRNAQKPCLIVHNNE